LGGASGAQRLVRSPWSGLIGVGPGARSVAFLVRQHVLIPQNQRLRREKAGDNP
jgi:hypothetical protein